MTENTESTRKNPFHHMFDTMKETTSFFMHNPFSNEKQEEAKTILSSWMELNVAQQKQVQASMWEVQQQMMAQSQKNIEKSIEMTTSILEAQQRMLQSVSSMWTK